MEIDNALLRVVPREITILILQFATRHVGPHWLLGLLYINKEYHTVMPLFINEVYRSNGMKIFLDDYGNYDDVHYKTLSRYWHDNIVSIDLYYYKGSTLNDNKLLAMFPMTKHIKFNASRLHTINVSRLTSLTSLDLTCSNRDYPGDDIDLSPLTHLRHLCLAKCNMVTDETLTKMTALVSLDLRHNDTITGAVFRTLTNLENLDVAGADLNVSCITDTFPCLSKLRRLTIGNNHGLYQGVSVTDNIANLVLQLPSLSHLIIYSTIDVFLNLKSVLDKAIDIEYASAVAYVNRQ